jgi:DNA polymerase III delta prime subunit
MFLCDSGGGKTSLINTIINEYYSGVDKLKQEENILSINSLKDQGITYYRNEVKTFCQSMSTIPLKKKFIVLDDIDSINEQSQQVFRNYIDKYSYNVHFISACSNIQKVNESIQSRMNIIKINMFNKTQLKELMERICTNENIKIEEDAKDFIISISNHSIRTLINYLEKCKLILYKDTSANNNNKDEDWNLENNDEKNDDCYEKKQLKRLHQKLSIDLELSKKICTNITFDEFIIYTETCKKCNLYDSYILLYSLFDKGYSVMDILDNYFVFLKCYNGITDDEKYNIIPVICKYITTFHNIHEDEIELVFFTKRVIDILAVGQK